MREFWDSVADENALFFVDDRIDYRNPDVEEFWRRGEEDLERVLALLGVEIGPEHRVVDLGCGVGRMTRPLAHRAGHVVALDISQRMLDHAHAANPDLGNVTWVHGDGTTLAGIDDASADGVFCFVVLQHVPDSEVILGYVEEMGRVLKPGGWAAFQFSNDPQIHRPPSRTRALLDRSARRQKDPAWVGSAVDLSDMRGTLDSSGLRVERLLNEGTQFCLVHAVKEFARLPIT